MITLRSTGLRSSVIIGSLLLSLLVACVPERLAGGSGAPEIGDGGFLSGEPCGPPCFRGIVPGVTTGAEAIQLLQAEGLDRKCESYAHSGGRGITCLSGIEIAFQSGTDLVEQVDFRLSRKVTVGDVIAKYGEPDAILVAVISRHPVAGMVLYYDDLKARLLLPEQDGTTSRVEPSTEIEHIAYLSTTAYTSHAPAIDALPNWNGYGEYEEYVSHE